ncbi:response regulator transcription factor [Haliovirga abyssi]|uniref:DNA-binding response regulator n=1 Tax=Haliovirga abyssi TaxID=2996794 RepID=A0AAU9D1Q5_9FUSO|nr:response regulator transcription factor [Haliovirga abyssi]BDU49931.1 DNA-binding response regulator [Haliovirga abyssi]
MEKILIVEDEKRISRFIELQLKHEGYKIDSAFDGREALDKIKNGDYDLVLLDIMIPKINGIEVCRRVREYSNIPIIMVTAKDEMTDKVIGLDLGANDYITKPFEIEELLARIRVQLRGKTSGGKTEGNILKAEDLIMNIEQCIVKRGEIEIELSKKEFELLEYLLINKGIVATRDKILNNVWGYDYFGNDNILDVHIKHLRDKIDKPFEKKLIKTVRGFGFTIKK